MESNLKIKFEEVDEKTFIVHFIGEFDKAGFMSVREELNRTVKAFDGLFLIFNFEKLKFINSEGIGYLMEIHSHFSTVDAKFSIVGVRSNVLDIFETIGLDEIIPIYENMGEFDDSINN